MNGSLQPMRFGISSLDRLLGSKRQSEYQDASDICPNDFGFAFPSGGSTSFCIIGTHGTGKSVLTLHLASRYFADYLASDSFARVFYISTDLSFSMAEDLWYRFALHMPCDRIIPFGDDLLPQRPAGMSPVVVPLQRRIPYVDAKHEENLSDFLGECAVSTSK